jgi:hypothetical protein
MLKDSILALTFPDGKLLLNGFMWQTDSTERLTFNTSNRQFLPAITLYTDSSELRLAASEDNSSKGFAVNFKRVDLVSLIPSGMVPGNPTARINGSVEYRSSGPENTGIKADLKITDIGYSDIRLNSINLDGTYAGTGNGQFRAVINADLDAAKIHAEAGTSGADRIITADITGFTLNLLKPFAKESLSELSGTLSGNLKSTASNGRQSLEGDVELDSPGGGI